MALVFINAPATCGQPLHVLVALAAITSLNATVLTIAYLTITNFALGLKGDDGAHVMYNFAEVRLALHRPSHDLI